MATESIERLSRSEIVKLKEEQDAFWEAHQAYLRSNEDMLGQFCRRHGRRVRAYPKLPSYAPAYWINWYRFVFDINVDECKACSQEQVDRENTNPTIEDCYKEFVIL
uniref:U2 protein n=1 Tax=Black medic leaf roll virus TaxID=2038729 RepID=V9TSL8_9VIRU|nr:U2 protein [Black medic leaf roll virus]